MSKDKLLILGGVGTLGMFFSTAAQATVPVLSLSKTTLIANTAGQTIQLLVKGTDTNIHGEEVDVQIADGGTANGGTATHPTITGLDLTTGTIFSGGLAGGQNVGPLIEQSNVILPLNTNVSDFSGSNPVVIATLTLDTTGFAGSSFTLSFENVGPNTASGPFFSILTDPSANAITPTGPGPAGASTATITVTSVPEPASFGLGVLCLGGVLLRRRGRDLAYTVEA